uniref:Bardet-Biedl syndrome 4 n=1 Tax=Panagrolaimus sp. ES5 TaxID=591445 RepID=A0AC34GTJ7_9BILA
MAEAEEIHEESMNEIENAKNVDEKDGGEEDGGKPSLPPSTPEPAYKRFIKPTMVNKCASRFNRKLHRLFLAKELEECSLLIEQMLQNEPEILCEYALICKAQIAKERGDAKTAVNSLVIALKHNPNSARLLYLLGKARYLQGEHPKAIECFKRALEYETNNWRCYYWCARSYYHSESEENDGNITKAQEVLMNCPSLDKCVDILVFLAKLCVQKNELVPAMEAFKRALNLEPENLDLIAELGLLYLKTGSDQKAFSWLGKALTYDATHVPSILAAATVLQKNNDFDVALTKYRVAAEKCDYNGPLWNNIGMCFYGKGKLVASIICLKKANYQCPLDPKVLFNLALVHRSMLQHASAYHFIASAINLQNKNVIFIMTIAVILSDLGDFTSARKAYKKALALDPGNAMIRVNFALFEYRRGNLSDAAAIIQNVNAKNLGESPEAAEVANRINFLRSCLAR